MKKLLSIVTLISTVFTTPLYAQSDIDSLRNNELNPVVIIGTGTYRKAANSPVAVTVLSAKDIKSVQATNLQDALSKLTSNISLHTNGMGTFVNFNGVSDDYIVILENGKRLSGDDRWSRISLDNVKRIEIFSGAASALYGSDALAGVINIITDDSKNTVEASAYTKIMNHGRMDQDINVDANIGKLSSQTSFSHRQADNWQVNHYEKFTGPNDEDILKLNGRPMSQGFFSNNISEKLEYKFNDQWSAYIRGNYYDNTTTRPQNAISFTQDKKDLTKFTTKKAYTYDLHHTSYLYGGGARWAPNNNTHIYLDIYSDQYKSKYDYWQTEEKEAYDEVRKQTRYTNETLRGIFRLTSWNKLSAGTELIQESLTSESDNINGRHTDSYNLFAQDEIQIAQGLEALLGLRYTYNTNFGSNVTPNIGLFYHISSFRFRASYAGGYRTPTLSQLYATDQAKTSSRYTINNTELRPEKNHFWNLNMEYGNKWMNFGITGFINNIRDMINYRTLSQQEIDADSYLSNLNKEWKTIRQRDNIDRATLRGFTATMKFIMPFGLSVAGRYSFTDANAKTKTLNTKTQEYVVTETDVDKSVRHIGSVNVSYDKTWNKYHLNIAVNGHVQGKRYSSTYGYAPGYGQWDLNTRHTFTMRQFVLEPGVGIDNIFNKRDTSYWTSNFSTINPGRSVYVSLALKFKD